MEDKTENVKAVRIRFIYPTNETKYYLLTEGSGYPLADFNYPGLSAQRGPGLVVPENRPRTSNLAPGTDASRLKQEI